MQKGLSASCSSSHGSHMILTLKRVRENEDPSVSNASKSSRSLLDSGSSVFVLDTGGGDDDEDDEGILRKALHNRPWINYCYPGSSLEEEERENDGEYCKDGESDSEQSSLFSISSPLPIGVIRGCKNCEGCQKVSARWRPEAGCRPVLEDAPVFFPLDEEFSDTMKYIASIRAEVEQYGICRIVPPHSWQPPCLLKDSEKKSVRLPTRVQQLDKLQVRKAQVKEKERQGRQNRELRRDSTEALLVREDDNDAASSDEEGKFGFEPGPAFTLNAFEKYAHQFKEEYFGLKDVCNDSVLNQKLSIECIEGEYWRIVEHPTEQLEVLYGADIETGVFGSGFPRVMEGIEPSSYTRSGWNLNNIAKLPGSVLSFEESEISGVVVPWLYVGMCFSSFCWHVEDHHFYSLNYIHFGSPKVWYGVPAYAADKLEEAMKQQLPDLFEEQPDLLHKLVTQLSPSILKEAGVPVYRAVQKAGEFIVTFPRAYHAGFNCGFNCAEAVNVAPIDWLPRGQIAVELYKQQMRRSTVSHDKLLIGTAKKALAISHHFLEVRDTADLAAWKDSFGLHYEALLTVLKNRVNMERTRRANVEGFVSVKKMDRNFDATDERECSVCHYDLHLSAIECECTSERYACLEHIDELCSCEKTRKQALYRYGLTELDALVAALEGNTDNLCDVKKLLEVCTGFGNPRYSSSERCSTHNNVATVDLDDLTVDSGFEHSWASSKERCIPQNDCVIIDLDSVTVEPNSLSYDCGTKCSAMCNSPVMLEPNGRHTSTCVPMTSIWSLDFDAVNAFLRNLENEKNPELLLTREKRKNDGFSVSDVPGCLVVSQQETEQPLVIEHPSKEKKNVEMIILSDDEDNTESQPFCNSTHIPNSRHSEYDSADKSLCPIESQFPLFGEQTNISSSFESHSIAPINRQEKSFWSNDLNMGCSQYLMPEPLIGRVDYTLGQLQKTDRQVQLLNTGRLVTGRSWHNKDAIFPAGFCSRILFPSILDPCQLCFYISEVMDFDNLEPLFKVVMEDCPSEIFIHPNIDRCWQMVQERLNMSVQLQHGLGLVCPEDVSGMDLFGFTTPYIIKAIEALDWQHKCLEYWTRKVSAFQLLVNQHQQYIPNANSTD